MHAKPFNIIPGIERSVLGEPWFPTREYCALDSSSLCGRAADDHTGVMKKPLSSVVAEETDLEN